MNKKRIIFLIALLSFTLYAEKLSSVRDAIKLKKRVELFLSSKVDIRIRGVEREPGGSWQAVLFLKIFLQKYNSVRIKSLSGVSQEMDNYLSQGCLVKSEDSECRYQLKNIKSSMIIDHAYHVAWTRTIANRIMTTNVEVWAVQKLYERVEQFQCKGKKGRKKNNKCEDIIASIKSNNSYIESSQNFYEDFLPVNEEYSGLKIGLKQERQEDFPLSEMVLSWPFLLRKIERELDVDDYVSGFVREEWLDIRELLADQLNLCLVESFNISGNLVPRICKRFLPDNWIPNITVDDKWTICSHFSDKIPNFCPN
ncbi:hypothetical protein N9N67_02965 [Bacteriovoracaceae bacterium]|nr:hypothetical protein [Bacteriovoracaceae bacterium]